jgi:hypothetical protein
VHDPWARRELSKLLIFPAFACSAAVLGALVADGDGAWLAYAGGLAAGLVAIAGEFLVRRARSELFVRDRAEIARRRARNRAAGRSIGAAVVVAALFGVAGGSLQAAAFGFAAGYLLPLSVFLFLHFARHRDEIRRLAAPSP